MREGTTLSDAVLIERPEAGLCMLVLNRPDKRNALTPDIREGLLAGLQEALADDAVRAIVVAGNGGLCAGGDISTMGQATDPVAGRKRMRSSHPVPRLLHNAEKPIVAAVEGFAVGAGAGLALLCDTIVAGEGATIGFPFFRIGLVPDWAILYTLPRRVGVGRAKQLLLAARMVKGPEALAIGLADAVVPDAEVRAEAIRLAAGLARQPRLPFAVAKRSLNDFPTGFEEVLALEATAQPLLRLTEDHVEGRTAFLEKRPPRFRGR